MFSHLSAEECGQLLYSLQEYARLLAKGDLDLGSVDSVMNTIDTGNYPAPRQLPWCIPFALKSYVGIQSSKSPWAGAFLLVAKKMRKPFAQIITS